MPERQERISWRRQYQTNGGDFAIGPANTNLVDAEQDFVIGEPLWLGDLLHFQSVRFEVDGDGSHRARRRLPVFATLTTTCGSVRIVPPIISERSIAIWMYSRRGNSRSAGFPMLMFRIWVPGPLCRLCGFRHSAPRLKMRFTWFMWEVTKQKDSFTRPVNVRMIDMV